jgi:hypothetical protein
MKFCQEVTRRFIWESMPIDKRHEKHFDSFILSHLTVQPDRDSINEYVRQMEDQLLDSNTELWFTAG